MVLTMRAGAARYQNTPIASNKAMGISPGRVILLAC